MTGSRRARFVSAALATVLLAGGGFLSAASPAQAAPPAPLVVTAAQTSSTSVSPATVTYTVNKPARQVVAVTYTVGAGASTAAALPTALTNKTSQGTISVPMSTAGSSAVVVTVTLKNGERAPSPATTVTYAPGPLTLAQWCTSVGGTLVLNSYYDLVGWDAEWACSDANTAWTVEDSLPVWDQVYNAYCYDPVDNTTYEMDVMTFGFTPELETFICYNRANTLTASEWCASVGGTYSAPWTFSYIKQDAIWSCRDADTDWTSADPGPVWQEISQAHCTDPTGNTRQLAVSIGTDSARDEFACYDKTTAMTAAQWCASVQGTYSAPWTYTGLGIEAIWSCLGADSPFTEANRGSVWDEVFVAYCGDPSNATRNMDAWVDPNSTLDNFVCYLEPVG